MAESLNYQQMSKDIVRLVGGVENIQSVSHCMTRLRFVLKAESKADTASLKAMKGVLGVVSAGGQYMIILGKNLPPVFEAVQKQFNLSEGQNTSENLDADLVAEKKPLTVKSAALAVLGYVSSSVSPMITGLVAGGMLTATKNDPVSSLGTIPVGVILISQTKATILIPTIENASQRRLMMKSTPPLYFLSVKSYAVLKALWKRLIRLSFFVPSSAL